MRHSGAWVLWPRKKTHALGPYYCHPIPFLIWDGDRFSDGHRIWKLADSRIAHYGEDHVVIHDLYRPEKPVQVPENKQAG